MPSKKKRGSGVPLLFAGFSKRVTRLAGRPLTFIVALGIILVWAILGPFLNYSDTWQLVINTGTSIITFLMVFIIQQSQNRDTMAMQLKLNELIAASERASNRLVDIEDLPEEELETLKKFYLKLSELAEKESNIFATHSIEEAHEKQSEKRKAKGNGEKQAGAF